MATTGVESARDSGRRLAQSLADGLAPAPAVSLRYGTVTAVRAAAGMLAADLTVSGGTLTGIPVTASCAGVRPGDRVIVETYARLSTVTGVLANTSAGRPLFDWSSTWSGTPSGEPAAGYVEKTQTVVCGGMLRVEVAAAIAGTGEYAMAVDLTDTAGKPAAYWCSTSPQKNGGTLRWVASGTIWVPPGEYTARLTTYHWGTVQIVGADSSGNSRKWRDGLWGTNGVPRYARIIQA